MSCPTPCDVDVDCDAPCHETHQPPHKRAHAVRTCELGDPVLTATGRRINAGAVKAPFWKKGAGC